MIVLNNDLFEISLIDDKYIIKAKSAVRKYYKLDEDQYKLFSRRLKYGVLTPQDIVCVYGNHLEKYNYEKVISSIELIFKSFETTTKKKKSEIHFKKLNKKLNLISANNFSFFFNKFFLITVYIAFAFSLFFLSYETNIDVPIFISTIWVIINILLHEFFHAFSLLFYKREILGVGFKMVYIFPYFFIRTTDIVMCGKKGKIIVSLMGPTINIILGLICFILNFFFSDIYLLNLAYMSYLFAISTFIPFLKSDGYRIICDIVDDDKISLNSLKLLKNFLFMKKNNYNKNIKIYVMYLLINFFISLCIIFSIYEYIT